MNFDSFDLIGAVPISTRVNAGAVGRAVTAGKRALAAAQKIQKRAPRLSAAVSKAGQRALAAAGQTAGAKPPPVQLPGSRPAGGVATTVPGGRTALGPDPGFVRPRAGRIATSPGRGLPGPADRRGSGKARLGEETPEVKFDVVFLRLFNEDDHARLLIALLNGLLKLPTKRRIVELTLLPPNQAMGSFCGCKRPPHTSRSSSIFERSR
jgi:hypothetical protein